MNVTRRDLFVWSAGAAAGLVFTPVPWKLLDDISIWTQNWPWIPQPARGPVEVKQSCCTLCPQGCGVRVRTAAGWPVGIAGVSGNPLTRGALCPLAFGAHQLNWHPRRVRTVEHKGTASSWNDAHAAFAKACSEGPVVIIDGRPGRSASSVLSSFAEKSGGSYRVTVSPETRAFLPYESWSGVPSNSLGYDLENARTIVSFGAPLLDGWGIPGRFTRLWAERAASTNDPHLRLIQIENSLSRTASRAWKWINIRSGSESALAAGLARVLIEEKLVAARGPMPEVMLSELAVQSGINESQLRELARAIVENPPVLGIANDQNPHIAALNVVLGAVGVRGGIVCKSKGAEKYVSADGEIDGARAVVIDSSVPWDFAPETDAEIFHFAAWDGGYAKSQWLLPAPGFLEELTDVPSAPTSATQSYAVAPQLAKPAFEAYSAAQFLGRIDPSLPTLEAVIRGRCERIFRERSGNLYGKEITPITKFDSSQKLKAELEAGNAMWIGDPTSLPGVRCELKNWPTAIIAESRQNWVSTWNAPVLPPLATKLYRESNLRDETDGRTA
jgi:Molybdopterin oxidoreductase/Molybdopterin oxidoreductase Fe4S4 domain